MVAAGTRIVDERSSPGNVSGSPGADRASPVLPAAGNKSVARHERSHDLARGRKSPGCQQ